MDRRNRVWTGLCLGVATVILLAVAGCNAVRMSRAYSELLDRTAALSEETATRAEADLLSYDELKAALRPQANVWRSFQDARDGKAVPPAAAAKAAP